MNELTNLTLRALNIYFYSCFSQFIIHINCCPFLQARSLNEWQWAKRAGLKYRAKIHKAAHSRPMTKNTQVRCLACYKKWWLCHTHCHTTAVSALQCFKILEKLYQQPIWWDISDLIHHPLSYRLLTLHKDLSKIVMNSMPCSLSCPRIQEKSNQHAKSARCTKCDCEVESPICWAELSSLESILL